MWVLAGARVPVAMALPGVTGKMGVALLRFEVLHVNTLYFLRRADISLPPALQASWSRNGAKAHTSPWGPIF